MRREGRGESAPEGIYERLVAVGLEALDLEETRELGSGSRRKEDGGP